MLGFYKKKFQLKKRHSEMKTETKENFWLNENF